MFDIAGIPIWQPRPNLDHNLVFQHGHAGIFTPHLEYLPEKLVEACSIFGILAVTVAICRILIKTYDMHSFVAVKLLEKLFR
jgi:hypothetical protein